MVFFRDCSRVAVNESQTAQLECTVAGHPIPQVNWTRNGVFVGTGIFTTPIVSINDHETCYTCIADNGVLNAKSGNVCLNVQYKPRNAKISSDKTSVCQNQKVTLTCTSGPANPAPSSYEFYNNGVLVGTSASNVYEATATAGLPDVNKFVCVLRNLRGRSVENGSVEVTAKDKPYLTTLTSILSNACVNDTVTLECTTDANPSVHEYRFYLNDELAYTSSSGVFQFNVPQAGNNTYKCETVNTAGTGQNASVTISTKEPPVIIASTKTTTVVEGQSLSLFCNATGLPVPNITWTKVGGSTVGSGETFTIASVVRGDEGSYRCTANNGDECSNATVVANVTVNYFTCCSCEQRRDTFNENKTIIATLGGLFALSLVLNIGLIAYCLRIKGSNDELHRSSNSNSKSGHVNDIPLQETRFKNTDLTPNSAPEHGSIGTRGLALSNPCFPEYEAVSTSTQPTNQPSAGIQANDLKRQRQSKSPQNVGQLSPTNMASIYQNIQLSRLTKLSTSNPSSFSSNQAGEYQALKQKGSSSQYQSLDELSRC